jgi:hypothetical protein
MRRPAAAHRQPNPQFEDLSLSLYLFVYIVA